MNFRSALGAYLAALSFQQRPGKRAPLTRIEPPVMQRAPQTQLAHHTLPACCQPATQTFQGHTSPSCLQPGDSQGSLHGRRHLALLILLLLILLCCCYDCRSPQLSPLPFFLLCAFLPTSNSPASRPPSLRPSPLGTEITWMYVFYMAPNKTLNKAKCCEPLLPLPLALLPLL